MQADVVQPRPRPLGLGNRCRRWAASTAEIADTPASDEMIPAFSTEPTGDASEEMHESRKRGVLIRHWGCNACDKHTTGRAEQFVEERVREEVVVTEEDDSDYALRGLVG